MTVPPRPVSATPLPRRWHKVEVSFPGTTTYTEERNHAHELCRWVRENVTPTPWSINRQQGTAIIWATDPRVMGMIMDHVWRLSVEAVISVTLVKQQLDDGTPGFTPVEAMQRDRPGPPPLAEVQ